MTIQEIKNDIYIYIIENVLMDAPENLNYSKNLFVDYDFDSITIIELILHIEEKYGVEFDILNLDFAELKSIDKISLNVFNMIKN